MDYTHVSIEIIEDVIYLYDGLSEEALGKIRLKKQYKGMPVPPSSFLSFCKFLRQILPLKNNLYCFSHKNREELLSYFSALGIAASPLFHQSLLINLSDEFFHRFQDI